MTDIRDRQADIIVVGGGLVGSAIAYGLTRHASRVMLLDEGDRAFRATRGNFGLVWVQSKGDGAPHYTHWTRTSQERWADFAAELKARTGVDTHHENNGGLTLCLSESEFLDRRSLMERHRRDAGNRGFEYKMLRLQELRELVPEAGDSVYGASFTPYDGTANPLFTLRAVHEGFDKLGGIYRPDHAVASIAYKDGIFRLETRHGTCQAPRVVIAAGNMTPGLARQVGMNIPLNPQRGEILVTERVAPFMRLPTQNMRQTVEGSIIMGDSKEDVGFDTSTDTSVISDIAARAVTAFPILRDVPVVRAWAALRVLSPDGLPIYATSEECPGAFATICHSGVTLAAAHANELGGWLMGADRPEAIAKLGPERFHVS
jgi:glycine/D-amino acid oxidase-like deaminating enzyme